MMVLPPNTPNIGIIPVSGASTSVCPISNHGNPVNIQLRSHSNNTHKHVNINTCDIAFVILVDKYIYSLITPAGNKLNTKIPTNVIITAAIYGALP